MWINLWKSLWKKARNSARQNTKQLLYTEVLKQLFVNYLSKNKEYKTRNFNDVDKTPTKQNLIFIPDNVDFS
jgi:hypothetical protein